MRTIEYHVERCHCWECGGYGKVSYIRDGDVEAWMECDGCEGNGELLRAKITQTTVIRAFLTQAKHALEDIELLDTDIDRIYGKIDDAIGDIERYERKVGSAMELDMTGAIDAQTADALAEAIRADLIDMGYGDILDFQWQLVVTFTDEDDDG